MRYNKLIIERIIDNYYMPLAAGQSYDIFLFFFSLLHTKWSVAFQSILSCKNQKHLYYHKDFVNWSSSYKLIQLYNIRSATSNWHFGGRQSKIWQIVSTNTLLAFWLTLAKNAVLPIQFGYEGCTSTIMVLQKHWQFRTLGVHMMCPL